MPFRQLAGSAKEEGNLHVCGPMHPYITSKPEGAQLDPKYAVFNADCCRSKVKLGPTLGVS